MNEKRYEFEERNNKISEIIESLNLTHEQKSGILRYEGEFQRNVSDLTEQELTDQDFMDKYNDFKNIRNEKIAGLLSEDQLTVIQNKRFLQ